MDNLIDELRDIAARRAPPAAYDLAAAVSEATDSMLATPPDVRPRDADDLPGGMIRLDPRLPCVVVPDVHARMDLVLSVLELSAPEFGDEGTLLDALIESRAQLVFVGDYVHAEARARRRWNLAFEEYRTGFARHRAMDAEMAESLGTLGMIARLKTAFPDRVHALKGNHENIANEERDGNLPFGKFVYEGAMVAEYMQRFYGGDAFEAVYRFEKTLPLIAVGGFYVVGHAEPQRFFPTDEVVAYRQRADVVRGLTWTANDEAESDSVELMLAHYLPDADPETRVYLGGHRPVSGRYHLRAANRYVQIHNPDLFIVALLSRPPFDPEVDVREIPKARRAIDG